MLRATSAAGRNAKDDTVTMVVVQRFPSNQNREMGKLMAVIVECQLKGSALAPRMKIATCSTSPGSALALQDLVYIT